MNVLHGLDSFNLGGIAEQILLLSRHSRHRHDNWGYAGSATPYMREAGSYNWEGGPPREAHYDVYVGHGVGGWSYNNTFDWAHERGMKTVEVMHSQARSLTDPSRCDAFVAMSDRALSLNTHMTRAGRIYGICEVERFHPERRGASIGRLSRLAEEKRPQDFVEIARHLPGQDFLMAGGGQLFDSLSAQRPSNLSMPGWVRDFPQFYERLKLFVFPTRDETCCMSVAMAQAAGLPVLAQDIPALRESTGGHAAWANDIPGFISLINQYLSDPGDFEEMAAAGRAWALSTFNVPVTVGAWDDLLESLL